MDNLLSLLKELLPIWAILLLLGFGYLIVLFRRVSDRFLDLASKQADYLKERVDVVDKSTGIFSRTIDQQEKEIARLTEQVSRLGNQLQSTRETDARLSGQELRLLASTLKELSAQQDQLRHALEARLGTSGGLPQLSSGDSVRNAVESGLPRAIRARDLSVFSVTLSDMNGASEFVDELQGDGLSASIYEASTNTGPGDAEGIWLGAAVPASIAVDVIQRARRRWPFLKYVHLSTDSSGPDDTHTDIYIGGATSSATTFLGCLPWSEKDFANLSPEMSEDDLHALVRERYKPKSQSIEPSPNER